MPLIPTGRAVSVNISNLSKCFGTQTVLHNINLAVSPREIFVIMGPSGSGKSVLLKNIIGLEEPTTGKVLINGLDAAVPSTHEKIVTSMVFQAGALFNSLTVYDNLALYPREHQLYDKKTLHDKVMYTLSMLSLEKAAQQYPSSLSGGMRKRVAIARSLMMEPELLLYDEPTSELDPIMSATIIEVIATLKEKLDVTTIVVSHDRDLAYSIADRVGIMFDGRMHLVATQQELKSTNDIRIKDFFNPTINIQNPRFKNKTFL